MESVIKMEDLENSLWNILFRPEKVEKVLEEMKKEKIIIDFIRADKEKKKFYVTMMVKGERIPVSFTANNIFLNDEKSAVKEKLLKKLVSYLSN